MLLSPRALGALCDVLLRHHSSVHVLRRFVRLACLAHFITEPLCGMCLPQEASTMLPSAFKQVARSLNLNPSAAGVKDVVRACGERGRRVHAAASRFGVAVRLTCEAARVLKGRGDALLAVTNEGAAMLNATTMARAWEEGAQVLALAALIRRASDEEARALSMAWRAILALHRGTPSHPPP